LTRLRWYRQNRRRCWSPSQNTTSRMELRNDRSAGNGANEWNGTTSRAMAASRP
jgi:hypothetical protein